MMDAPLNLNEVGRLVGDANAEDPLTHSKLRIRGGGHAIPRKSSRRCLNSTTNTKTTRFHGAAALAAVSFHARVRKDMCTGRVETNQDEDDGEEEEEEEEEEDDRDQRAPS
uniref:Uncharacterized protein n=1 Tax=Anopheles merus TaxID=30066 RepID=A0A182VNS7_ANOME